MTWRYRRGYTRLGDFEFPILRRHRFCRQSAGGRRPHDHQLTNRRAIPLTRIAEESPSLREAGSGTRLAAERLFAEHDLQPRARLELGSNEAVKQAVAGGLGLPLLSAHTLALEGESGLLRVLDVAGLPMLRQWYVAYQRGRHLSVVAEAFLDFLLADPRR